MKRLLLDTHALLWWLDDSPRLGKTARLEIESAASVAVSLASLWEIAVKISLGKLVADLPELVRVLDHRGIPILQVTPADCLAVAGLPHHHRDPFDRMIIVQARARGLTIVSDDANFPPYGVALVRCS